MAIAALPHPGTLSYVLNFAGFRRAATTLVRDRSGRLPRPPATVDRADAGPGCGAGDRHAARAGPVADRSALFAPGGARRGPVVRRAMPAGVSRSSPAEGGSR